MFARRQWGSLLPHSNVSDKEKALRRTVDELAATDAGRRSWMYPEGIVMSGRRPLIKGYFGVALVASAVMSSAFFCGE